MILLLLVAGFLAFETLGYCIHRLMHWRGSGALYRAHMAHHAIYTADDFTSGTYRSVGRDSTTPRFVAVALLLACLALVWVPFRLWWPLVLEMAVIGVANDLLHTALHVRLPWLVTWLPQYQRWRALHVQHHRDSSTNFGIWFFGADRLLGTYKNPQS